LADDKYRRTLRQGEVLVSEGDPGDCAFVIESGSLEVWRERDGQRDVLAVLGPGEMFGEMSLIDKLARSASAAARTDTRLRVVTREHLEDKLAEADPFLRLLLKMILKRYRSTTSAALAGADEMVQDREAVLKRIRLEQELEQALERREFVLHFQPIVDLRSYRTAGFEALIRWISPTRGFVSPGEFMPAVEDSPLIHGVGLWVMQATCEAVKRLNVRAKAAGLSPIFISFNVSGRQLSRPELVDQMGAVLKASGIEPHLLKMEVTESMLMADLDHALEILGRCRKLGMRIAMDDFGTGYSSLSYLHRLPVDTLKVDRSFITPLLTDEGSGKIVHAIGNMAHSLNMDIVAEGIEQVGQAGRLQELDVEYGQGYVFSKPVGEDKAAEIVGAPWPWTFERRSDQRRHFNDRRDGDRRA